MNNMNSTTMQYNSLYFQFWAQRDIYEYMSWEIWIPVYLKVQSSNIIYSHAGFSVERETSPSSFCSYKLLNLIIRAIMLHVIYCVSGVLSTLLDCQIPSNTLIFQWSMFPHRKKNCWNVKRRIQNRLIIRVQVHKSDINNCPDTCNKDNPGPIIIIFQPGPAPLQIQSHIDPSSPMKKKLFSLQWFWSLQLFDKETHCLSRCHRF